MTKRQVEELGKLYIDMGKLVVASFVLGLFQSGLSIFLIMALGLFGRITSDKNIGINGIVASLKNLGIILGSLPISWY